MDGLLAYGMNVGITERDGDITIIGAIIGSLLLMRFVARIRLTPMSGVMACFAGALWAYLIEGWGLLAPSFAALAALISTAIVARGAGHRDGPA